MMLSTPPWAARAGVRERQSVAVADADVGQRPAGDDERIAGFPGRDGPGELRDVVQLKHARGVLKHHVDDAVVDGVSPVGVRLSVNVVVAAFSTALVSSIVSCVPICRIPGPLTETVPLIVAVPPPTTVP